MVTISDLLDDCFEALAKFESDLRPFLKGRVKMDCSHTDVTADHVNRTEAIVAKIPALNDMRAGGS